MLSERAERGMTIELSIPDLPVLGLAGPAGHGVRVGWRPACRHDRRPDPPRPIDALEHIVIIDPARIEVGFWLRQANRSWRAEIVADPEAVPAMPSLGLSLGLASLYETIPPSAG